MSESVKNISQGSQDFNPLVKNFLDSVNNIKINLINILIFLPFLQNKLLIINYYLCCQSDLSEEERNILLFLKQKWIQKLMLSNESDGDSKNKDRSDDSSVDVENIMNKGKEEDTPSLTNIYKGKRRRSPKKVTNCPHIERSHYAKNMCYNCYHSKGRNKKAWKCEHRNKMHYAKGLCQNCYHTLYKKAKPEVVKNATIKAWNKKREKKLLGIEGEFTK